MKITQDEWLQWAHEYASDSADDFAAHAKNITLEQHIILKAKIEAAALYGIELAATMVENGGELSHAKVLKPGLFRSAEHDGDQTYTMEAVPDDCGGIRLVHPAEDPEFPRDGTTNP